MQWRQGTIIFNVCKFENDYWTSELINCWWKEGCQGEEVCTGLVWCYILVDNCGREPRIISGCDRENLWVCSRRRCESPSEDRSCELVNAKSSGLMSSQPRVLQRPYREISVVARQLWNQREGTREKNEAVGWGLLRFANCADVKNLYIYPKFKICWHYQCVMSLTMLPITPGRRWTDPSIMLLQTS